MNHSFFGVLTTNLGSEFRIQQDYSFSVMQNREDCYSRGDFMNGFADTGFSPFN